MQKRKEVHSKKRTVAVIGLGYVGLPLACLAAEKGWKVIGLARDQKKIDLINRRISPIKDRELELWLRRVTIEATSNEKNLTRASVVVICVPTPIDRSNNPDFTAIISAAKKIARNLRKGQLIILESTVSPGVCQEIILPILEGSGLVCGQDFYLAHCPERIDPGNTTWNVRNIPRVVGGFNNQSQDKALRFYRSVIEADVYPMKSLKEAEAVKILENSFRDVNIAFVNEIAKSFERLGIDAVDVIRGASTKPFAFLPHWPSAGVGGHCIPVDPYYLIERARKSGFDHAFLRLARTINNSMPGHVVKRLQEAAGKKYTLNKVVIGVAGLAYKKGISDTRESPTYELLKILQRKKIQYEVFDPRVLHESTVSSLTQLLKTSDIVILMTDHREFHALSARRLRANNIKIVIDGKNFLNKKAIEELGILYRGIGR